MSSKDFHFVRDGFFHELRFLLDSVSSLLCLVCPGKLRLASLLNAGRVQLFLAPTSSEDISVSS